MRAHSTPLSLAALVIALAAPCSALAHESYKVTGVALGDTLVVRAEPDEGGKPADWKEQGRIPADASGVLGTGRSKEIAGQQWSEIVHGATRGWVNAKFLAAADEFADLKGATFECAGTEPFWSVTLSPTGGEFADPEQKHALKTEGVQPSTARLFPLLYRMKDANGRSYRATVTHASCTDGMSDYSYGFEVLLSGDENFEQGCCVIAR